MDWTFPISNGGQFHGIGDSGIDLFRGDPIKGLTREICQNSIDARADQGKPVRVEFESFTVPTDKLPGKVTLLENYEQAARFCHTQNFSKADKYFKRTIPILKDPEIQVLRISDYNTTGLTGADKAGTDFSSPWFRLVRSVGSSDKSEGSIGAFGSGKQACYSCSKLQTVFYSTFDNKKVEAYQGVSKLICFLDDDSNLHSDIGYFSEENSMPICQQLEIEDGFKRTETGTDIYIIAFKGDSPDWKKELIASVLDGFFYAVKEGHLIVKVEDSTIDKESIHDLIEEYQSTISPYTYDYYRVLTESDVEERQYSYLEKNDIVLRMLMKPDLHRRIAIIRYPGMKVFDKGGISATVPFSGVCVIKGKEISTLFGGLENIQHNAWELSRYSDDPQTKKKADQKIKRLNKDIKTLFNEMKGQDTEGEIDPEVGDCLPDPMSEKEETQESIKNEVSVIKERKVADVASSSNYKTPDEDGSGDISGEGETPGSTGGPGIRNGKGHVEQKSGTGAGNQSGNNQDPSGSGITSGSQKGKRIPAKIRYMAVDVEKGIYKIYITPKQNITNGSMVIYMSAETDRYKADIISAMMNGRKLDISGNVINGFDVVADVKAEIMISINYSDICSLEVSVYGH